MSDFQSTVSWVPVQRFEGLYEANASGDIRRIGRAMGARFGRLLVPKLINSGYLVVHLSRTQVVTAVLVHRVIAEAFIGVIPDGHQVNHKNGIKTDNRADNLEIVTQHQNMAHAIATGLYDIKGERHHNAVLTLNQVEAIRAEYQANVFGYKRLAAKYGVGWGAIRDIIKRRNWFYG